MIEVNAEKARGELGSLLKRVEAGEEVVISRRGRKVAKMVSFAAIDLCTRGSQKMCRPG